MKILYVTGEDYAATTFEDEVGIDKAGKYWEQAWKEDNHHFWDDNDIEYCAYEFYKVDPKFISFVKSEVIDYDDGKHSNFYVVEN